MIPPFLIQISIIIRFGIIYEKTLLFYGPTGYKGIFRLFLIPFFIILHDNTLIYKGLSLACNLQY